MGIQQGHISSHHKAYSTGVNSGARSSPAPVFKGVGSCCSNFSFLCSTL